MVDASSDKRTADVCGRGASAFAGALIYRRARYAGAARQRNEGVEAGEQPFVFFFDDDVLFEPDCCIRLWRAIEADAALGAVNAMITNQQYEHPGRATRMLLFLLNRCRGEKTYAGRVIGPGMNLLPADQEDLPEVVPVEWLNTTCTLYRREALPQPPFPPQFTGYSLMEDLALSLTVAGRGWRLANARTARILHDSQPGEHKSDAAALSRMELVNRHFIMTSVLGRDNAIDYIKLAVLESFFVTGTLTNRRTRRTAASVLRGKVEGVRDIIRSR